MGTKGEFKKIGLKEYEKGTGKKSVQKMRKRSLKNEMPDIPKKVNKIKIINDIRYYKIKWRKRRNNNNPNKVILNMIYY